MPRSVRRPIATWLYSAGRSMDMVPPWASRVRLPNVAAGALAIEIRGGEPADASSHDDQVVGLTGAFRLADGVPGFAVAEPVGVGKGAVVVTADAGEGRGIVAGRLFGGVGHFVESQGGGRNQGTANGEGNSIQEIAVGNGTVHSKMFVVAHRNLKRRCLYREGSGESANGGDKYSAWISLTLYSDSRKFIVVEQSPFSPVNLNGRP